MAYARGSCGLILAGLLPLAGPCGPNVESQDAGPPQGTSTGAIEDGTSTGEVASTADAPGSSSGSVGSTGAPELDPQLEAIANLRATLGTAGECLDLRKIGQTDEGPPVMVMIDVPPSNLAEPGEELAVRTYVLPEDADDLQMRAFILDEAAEVACEQVPSDGTEFEAIAGTFEVEYEVVDNGCIFSCDRLFVDITDLVMQRDSDGATVDVGTLYVPSWRDPDPPE